MADDPPARPSSRSAAGVGGRAPPPGDLRPKVALAVGCAATLALYALLARAGALGFALGWLPALAVGVVAGALWPLTLGAALWAAILWPLARLVGGC